MAHRVGELGTARACARKGLPTAISTFANHTVVEIGDAGQAVARSPPFLTVVQIYTMRNRQRRDLQRVQRQRALLGERYFVVEEACEYGGLGQGSFDGGGYEDGYKGRV